jgi:hypothetical protein
MEKDVLPFIPDKEIIARVEEDRVVDPQTKMRWLDDFKKISAGEVFIRRRKDTYVPNEITNVWASQCYSCDLFALWLHGDLIYPAVRYGEEPNEDLPEDIQRDYDEARSVLAISPRSAAALLRLCIQKICRNLGANGSNINSDIAVLVSKGLDAKVQQALDIVRVIGNNAVHPGQIDLQDDRAIATHLFRLVNLIAEKMISEPKHIQTMFDTLPESARAQIANRDNRRESQ